MPAFDKQFVALRGQFLAMAKEPGPEPLRGAVMDLGMGHACGTVVCAADGSTSIYFSTGGGTIGAGAHQTVAAASKAFLTAVDQRLAQFGPVVDDAPPALAKATVQFVAVTTEGLRTLTVAEADARQKTHAAYPLYAYGQNVITQIRLLSA